MKKHQIILFSLVWAAISTSGIEEKLHVERFLEGGKAFVRVLVPKIIQTEEGITIVTAIATDSGPTFINQWFNQNHNVNFPTIAVSNRVDLADWSDEFELPDGKIVFEGAQHFFDNTNPELPNHYEIDRNGGWVNSSVLGWTNLLHYPWVYEPSIGWTYLLQSEPVWHGMGWYGYSVERGLIFIAEVVPDLVFVFEEEIWMAI